MAIKFNPATGKYENYNPADGSWNPVVPGNNNLYSLLNQVPVTTMAAPSTTVPAKTPSKASGRASKPSKGRQGPVLPQGPVLGQQTASSVVPVGAGAGFHGAAAAAQRNPYTQKQFQQYLQTQAGSAAEGQFAGMGDLLKMLSGLGATGGGGTALQAAKGRAGYTGGMAAATEQEKAAAAAQAEYNRLAQERYGQQMQDVAAAQEAYNQLAQQGYTQQMQDIGAAYNPQMEAIKNYFASQGQQAGETISQATAGALAGLTAPTAYQGLTAPLVSAPTQGLDLATYGATGEMASQQAATDAATAKFISDLVGRGYQQTQAVNQDYMTALQNAVRGSGTQAAQQLQANIAALQGQELGNLRGQRFQQEQQAADLRNQLLTRGIDAMLAGRQGAASIRDQLAQAGIEAAMSGKEKAAATRAATLSSYGAYAPKKKVKPVKTTKPAKSGKSGKSA